MTLYAFMHPSVGVYEKADVQIVFRTPEDESVPVLPCLRISLSAEFLDRVLQETQPAVLRWNYSDQHRTFGIMEPNSAPWLVLMLNGETRRFVNMAERVGLWALELEAAPLKVVWFYSNEGGRAAVAHRLVSVSDFMQSYLSDEVVNS